MDYGQPELLILTDSIFDSKVKAALISGDKVSVKNEFNWLAE